METMFCHTSLIKVFKNYHPEYLNQINVKYFIEEVGINTIYLSGKGDIFLSNNELDILFKYLKIKNTDFIYQNLKNKLANNKIKISFNSFDGFKKKKKVIDLKSKEKKRKLKEQFQKEEDLIARGLLESRAKRRLSKTLSHALNNTNVIATIDLEFIRNRKGTFITEVGIIKFNKKLNSVKCKHFVMPSPSKVKSKYTPPKMQYLLSLSDPIYYKNLRELAKEIECFMLDVELVVGHAVKQDFELLKNFNLYSGKPKLLDTQKLIFHKTNEQLSLINSLKNLKIKFNFDLINENKIDIINDIIKREERHKSFSKLRDNFYDKIALHNALNDAICTFLVFINVVYSEKDCDYFSDYNQFENFLNDCQKKYQKNVDIYLKKIKDKKNNGL